MLDGNPKVSSNLILDPKGFSMQSFTIRRIEKGYLKMGLMFSILWAFTFTIEQRNLTKTRKTSPMPQSEFAYTLFRMDIGMRKSLQELEIIWVPL